MEGIATDLAGSAAIPLGFSAGSQCLVPPTVVGATGAGMVGKRKGPLVSGILCVQRTATNSVDGCLARAIGLWHRSCMNVGTDCPEEEAW